MVWKGDTLVYNADAFNVPEGSMLDGLIKQLPGVELTDEGEIFVNGKKIDNLTLKSSYGEQGNMLDNQTPEMIIKKGNMSAYYNEMTSTAAYFANPDLKWEKTHSTNLGLEVGFFDNRLNVRFNTDINILTRLTTRFDMSYTKINRDVFDNGAPVVYR